MEVTVYTLNAFTKESNGGNPAGVVLDSDHLSEDQMKFIAKEVGFSETAFVQQSSLADFKFRYFTPLAEVDLCGHATIASFHILQQNGISNGTYTIETKAGILEVCVDSENIFLSQAIPYFDKVLDAKEIANSLNIVESDIDENLPIQIVSTGLRDILIPIKTKEVLNLIQPNEKEIARISEKYTVIGYHLFTLDTVPDITASCRNFAPLYGILEESATGTSNGALTTYLHKYGVIWSGAFVFEQGVTMGETSEIISKLVVQENGEIQTIQVGGTAGRIQKRVITC